MKNILLVIVCSSVVMQAQILEDERQHELLLRGIHYTLQQRYDSAESTFRSLMREFPTHPSGYLYLAGMLQARYTDLGDRFHQRQYDSLLTAAGTLAESLLRNKKTAAAGYYYAGASDAFRSFTASENGNLPTGFYYGVSAGNLMEKCLQADSQYIQAKNILGSYYFWRSKLAWIPFVSDRTEEGIELIRAALNHPYEKHLASHNLMLIFIDEKRFADAEQYGAAMLALYPRNRSFLWNMMTVYEQWGKEEALMSVVQRLLQSALEAPVINRYTEAVCRLKIAQHAYRQKDYRSVREECEKIVGLRRFTGTTKGDLKKKISMAEDLLESINEP